MDIIDLARKIRENQGVDILIPKDPEFNKWIKARLMNRLGIATESLLSMALKKSYSQDPYKVAWMLQNHVSEWYEENRSGYDSKIS